MRPIVWSEKLSVGIPVMDLDHEELIRMLNRLGCLIGHDKKMIGVALDELIAHVVSHFKREENLFLGTPYSEAQKHKNEHDSLLWEVGAIQQAFHDGHMTFSVEVFRFLRKWLLNHIQTSDRDFALYALAKDDALETTPMSPLERERGEATRFSLRASAL